MGYGKAVTRCLIRHSIDHPLTQQSPNPEAVVVADEEGDIAAW